MSRLASFTLCRSVELLLAISFIQIAVVFGRLLL
jgi:hypothetical protein